MKVRAYRARGFAGLGYLRAPRDRRGEIVGYDHRLMLGRLVVIGQTGILEPIARTPRRRRFPEPPAPDAYRGYRSEPISWEVLPEQMLEKRAFRSIADQDPYDARAHANRIP